MAYPTGVLTRQVNIVALHDLAGNAVGGQVQVECATSLKWAATGELILNKPETIFLDTSNGTGSITLPIIQQGFLGPDGAVLSKWTYTFTPILDPNVPVVEPYVLELGYGDGVAANLDFDDPTPSVPGALIYRPGAQGADGEDGPPGPPTTLTVGSVIELPYGEEPTVEIVGGAPNYTVNFGIPAGAPGSNGSAAGVPVGGVVGQVLTKNGVADFATAWQDNAAQGIPAAGAAGQILAKVDGADYNTHWVDIPTSVPNGGDTGEVLTKNSPTDQDFGWTAIPEQHDLPVGGVAGQLLAKLSSTDREVDWIDPPSGGGTGLPAGGTAGQILTKTSSVDGVAGWSDPVFSINSLPSGTIVSVVKAAGVWPARPTARPDITVLWIGSDPSPSIVSSGTGGMLDGIDLRMVTP